MNSTMQESEKPNDKVTLTDLQKVAGGDLLNVSDSVQEWNKSEDQSGRFKELAQKTEKELNAEYKQWLDIATV